MREKTANRGNTGLRADTATITVGAIFVVQHGQLHVKRRNKEHAAVAEERFSTSMFPLFVATVGKRKDLGGDTGQNLGITQDANVLSVARRRTRLGTEGARWR